MEILSGKETAEFLEDVIHLETQSADKGVDLTVAKIYELQCCGEIDFGGSEREDADISEIEPTLRSSEDDYGWWELKPGTYLLEYNESFKTEKESLLQPLPRLTRNSATHPTELTTKLEPVPLYVGGEGIAIKENSRVSRMMIFEE